ncbi:Na+ dependent nucleoside transporter-like protein, partial [Cladochytrium replicatum]
RLQGLFGNVVWVAIGYAVSRRRKDINWRLVWTGVMLQFVFALLVLRTQAGFDLFDLFANLATTLIGYSSEGVKFLVNEVPGNFLGSVPATIIFFSALISVLYFWGIMTKFLAKVIRWVMGEGVSGREAICAAANIFVGQTEAPLLIKPLLPYMTGSEIHTVMTAGFATIAGGVFFAYVRLGVDPRALLTASVISAPASIVISKLFLPEDEKDAAKDKALDYKPEFGEEVNFMHAAANGATQGMMLALNVIGSLIAVLGLFYTADGIFTFICRSLDPTGSLPEGFGLITVFSYIGYPIAWLMGVPNEDLLIVGQVVSQKTILNEFVAYLSLSDLIKAKTISYRAEIIATYALCGFSNIASIGIQIGGIGGIAPTRKGEIASLAFSAMIAGSIACFMTASIAGMLI